MGKIDHFTKLKGKRWVDNKLNFFKNRIRRKVMWKLGIKGRRGRYMEEESQEVAEDQPEDSYRSRSGKWLRRKRRLRKLRKFRRVLRKLWRRWRAHHAKKIARMVAKHGHKRVWAWINNFRKILRR